MGLYIKDTWTGSYSSFNAFREALADAAGLGWLGQRAGFGGDEPFDPNHPLTALLNHSDCDGVIPLQQLSALQQCLQSLTPKLPAPWAAWAAQFADGCQAHIDAAIDMRFE